MANLDLGFDGFSSIDTAYHFYQTQQHHIFQDH